MKSRYLRQIQVLGVLVVMLAASATALHAQTYTVLHTYPVGAGAYSGITFPQVMSQGRDGDLYSTINNDGTKNVGTVYKITTAGALTTIYSFCSRTLCADGSYPYGGVTLGFDGDLYGTTGGGGKYAAGTVFKVTPTGTLTTLWNFDNKTDDSAPVYATLQGQDGNTYGVSEVQYVGQYGAFFRITPSDVFKAFVDFNYTDGSLPNLPTQGTDGNFYGTTKFGGSKNLGLVYKITPAGKITVLHNFTGYPSDGTYPLGILVQGPNGNFYGTTYQGGAYNEGTVFKITPAGVYTLLHSFRFAAPGYDGQLPEAGLTLGTDGNFYGTTLYGGMTNYGTIFKITPAGKETVLYNFCYKTCDGFGATTPLVLHTNGKFYGNTNGNSNGGSVFYSLNVGLKPFVNLVTWSGKVGATVGILGQGFAGTTSVSFNGTPAKSVTVSGTFITATVPAGAKTGTVTVGTLKSNRAFLVTPQITRFTPASGAVGTLVTITGVSLAQTTHVTIGGKGATFTVKSDTEVTATVPTGATTGKIQATTPGGTATSSTNFTVT
jgi:uncharacterized repeat protein (TIGR03803 family)